jgi:DNA primase
VGKVDYSPLQGRKVIIWPDNDEPGVAAAIELSRILAGITQNLTLVLPPNTLPEGWDLADQCEPGFFPQVHVETAMPVTKFIRKVAKRYPVLSPSVLLQDSSASEIEGIIIKEFGYA